MEKIFSTAEELAVNVKEYVNSRIESAKLTAAEKSSRIISNIAAAIAVVLLFFLFIIFGGIALSFGLGEWIGKIWAGFLIVATLYLLIGIMAWIARGKFIRLPIMNALVKQLFNEDGED